MADIQLRFNRDVLVIGSPVQTQLANVPAFPDDESASDEDNLADITGAQPPLGSREIPTDAASFDTELALVLEPELFEDAFNVQIAAGAQCLVAPTANLTPARLAHTGMAASAEALARTALEVANAPGPEHVLVELSPCGLPLDAASKASLLENRQQYERAARLFDGLAFDAFFLNGFTSTADLKCALMGIRKVSDAPVLASVDVNAEGMLCPLEAGIHAPAVRESLEDAAAIMAEFGAQVAGFCTAVPPEVAANLAARVASVTNLPLLVQLSVTDTATPDDAFDDGLLLANAGVQFLRVTGQATPAFTGALAAATFGMAVQLDGQRDSAQQGGRGCGPDASHGADSGAASDPAALADRLRRTVNDALGIGGAQ